METNPKDEIVERMRARVSVAVLQLPEEITRLESSLRRVEDLLRSARHAEEVLHREVLKDPRAAAAWARALDSAGRAKEAHSELRLRVGAALR